MATRGTPESADENTGASVEVEAAVDASSRVAPGARRHLRRRRAPLALRVLSVLLAAATSAAATTCAGLVVAQRLGYLPYAVVSGSMEPEVPVGSLVFANSNVAYGEELVGEVIAFRTTGPVMVHRAVEATEEGLVTKGDANDEPDGGVVGAGSYIGAVQFFIPQAGVIFAALGTVEGMLALALLALASLAMRFAVRRWTRPQVVQVATSAKATPQQDGPWRDVASRAGAAA